jgi:tetratricopeptide (TPR) repeat protein
VSFAALRKKERWLLLRLSVLPAPFGPEVVTAVSDTGPDKWAPAAAALVGASLWRLTNDRYAAHPLVRHLAREKFGPAHGEVERDDAERYVAERVAGLAKQKFSALRADDRASIQAYLNWCEAELPNLIALADAAVARRTSRGADRRDAAVVVDLAWALSAFWTARGYWDVADRLYQKAAESARAASNPAAEAWCLGYRGYVCRHLGRLATSEASYREALRLCDTNAEADRRYRALISSQYGKLLATSDPGRRKEAIALLAAAVTRFNRDGDPDGEAGATIYLAQAHKFGGDLNQAEELFRTALAGARRANNKDREAECLYQLGNTYLRQSRIREAERNLRESLALAQATDDRVRQSQNLVGLGFAAIERGAWNDAEKNLTAGLQLARSLGLRLHEGHTMRRMADKFRDKGDLGRARALAQTAVDVLSKSEDAEAAARARQTLAAIEGALAKRGPAGA